MTVADLLFVAAKWAGAACLVAGLVVLVLYVAAAVHESDRQRDARRRNRHGDQW